MYKRVGLTVLSLCLVYVCARAFTALDKDNFPDENLLPYRNGNGIALYQNGWDDAKGTRLGAKAGVDGQRKKLPEKHLTDWGYGIEIGDCKVANEVGVYDLVAYLCWPTKDHSKNPNNAENYPPLNLYEPIFNSSGGVNENNYWANYVAKLVRNYKNFTRIYEVWNEPDYTTDWRNAEKWETDPPTADDKLTHWNGNIFEYNRLMRITYEVVKSIDPTAWVATGGLGYTSFLDAMLRYTDNPDGGSVTDKYPNKGGAYFDCLAYHQYPQYGVTDEVTGIGYHGKGSDNLVMKFVTLKNNMQHRLEKYGFDGEKYPRKMFICTETGLSDGRSKDGFGGDVARRNYIIKQMAYAREYGIKQTHWLYIADSGTTGMGDFSEIYTKTLETAEPKDSSKGRLTWNSLDLSKMDFDAKRTTSTREMLAGLEKNLTAAVFKANNIQSWTYSPNETLKQQPNSVFLIWRRCDGDEEVNETVTVSLKLTPPCKVIRYDGSSQSFDKSEFEIEVDGTPVFVVSADVAISSASTFSITVSMLLGLVASILAVLL